MKKYVLTAALAAAAVAGVCVSPQTQAGESFGTARQSLFVPVFDFHNISDPSCGFAIGTDGLFWHATCAGTYYATYELPEGALVDTVYLQYFDNEPAGSINFSLVRFNAIWSGGTFGSTEYNYLTTNVTTVDAASTQTSAFTPDFTFDSYNHMDSTHSLYGVRMAIDSTSSSLLVRGAWIWYSRQQAPVPASATFNDVATSHPFFGSISQMQRAGVTGGCGSGNYCPDAPVTRGQMAAFLSRSLGLAWDNNTNAN